MLSPRPNFRPSITHKNQKLKTKVKYIPNQARCEDSVTAGGRNKFWGAWEVYVCEFERGTGSTRNLSQSGSNEQGEDQKFIEIFRLKSEIEAFFRPKTGDHQKKERSSPNFKGIFRPKSEIQTFFLAENRSSPQKKVFIEIPRNFAAKYRWSSKKKEKRSSSQKCHEIRGQSTKILKIPVTNTNLGLNLHSSSPKSVNFFGAQSSLGGHKQSLGGHVPGMPPCGIMPVPST